MTRLDHYIIYVRKRYPVITLCINEDGLCTVWTTSNLRASLFSFRVICYNLNRLSKYYNLTIYRFKIENDEYSTAINSSEAECYSHYGCKF